MDKATEPPKKRRVWPVLALVALLLALLLFGGPLLNNLRMWRLAAQWKAGALPEGATGVQAVRFCGNSSGTGNHTEILVGLIVHYEGDDPAALVQFADEQRAWLVPLGQEGAPQGAGAEILEADGTRTLYSSAQLGCLGVNPAEYAPGHYLIVRRYNAVTQLDLRGH